MACQDFMPALLPKMKTAFLNVFRSPLFSSSAPLCQRLRLPAFGTVLLASLALAATAQAKDCIGVVPAGGGYTFWKAVQAGAEQAGRELGVEIYFRGPSDEADVSAQGYIIHAVAQRHCKALVLAPNAPERMHDVAMLEAQGIPTVYTDRGLGGNDIHPVIATDNFKAGMLAGQEMAKALGGKGRVALLRLKQGVTSTSERERGFAEAARKAGLAIVLDRYLGTTVGEARGHALQILAGMRGRIDGVFTPNESTTVGTLKVLKETGMAGTVQHIGFDSNDKLVNAISNGELYGLIVQRPFAMGYQGVRLAWNKAQGKPRPNRAIDTGVAFVTKANLTQPAIERLLHPDTARPGP
jgi:ribose transport system substrate-binding protein